MTGPRIGLDIGGTKTLGVLVDDAGRVVDQVREETEPGAEGVVRTAARVVGRLGAGGPGNRVGGVGVGVPGLVEPQRGAVQHAVNLGVDGEWLPLRDRLEEVLGVPVAVENDVNAAALGAVAWTGVRDLAYLSIGTGLAAGLVLEGRLRRGFTGAAGEIGHLAVDADGELCRCGQRGCLETVASGRALRTGPELADGFASGVADAVRVLCLAVDPETVVLGGGVAQLGQPLVDAVAAALRRQTEGSPFLASLDLAGRLRLIPADQPVAALGAALLVGS